MSLLGMKCSREMLESRDGNGLCDFFKIRSPDLLLYAV